MYHLVGQLSDYVVSAGQPFDQAMAGKGGSFDANRPASQNQAQGKPMRPVSVVPQQLALRSPARSILLVSLHSLLTRRVPSSYLVGKLSD